MNPKDCLSGYRVLDLSTGVAGPYATKLMASLGAEVVKIESPDGGDESRREGPFPDDVPHPEKSALFLYLNTSKKGVTLDLGSLTGQAILKRLASQADVLVESFPPLEAASLGLEYEALQQVIPGLVVTSVTDFGLTGPYSNHSMKTLNHYAYGGLMYITGKPEKEPLQMGPRVCRSTARGRTPLSLRSQPSGIENRRERGSAWTSPLPSTARPS